MVANIDFPSNPIVGQRYAFAGVTYTYSAQGVWSPAGASIVVQSLPQGRLTLQSGVPVMTTTTSGVTSIYYTPYVGNRIPIWDGVQMSMRRFDEIQTTTVDFTNNPAPVGNLKINDWFIYPDASGTLRICHGPDWTDNTTRSAGTILIRQEGLLLNNVAITNGPAAMRGTYVGTTMSNTTGKLDWIYGVRSSPPVGGFFGVWNMYFRAYLASFLSDSMGSWTYTSSTPRQANNQPSAKFEYVSGIAEDVFVGHAQAGSWPDTQGYCLVSGVGYDTINSMNGLVGANTGPTSVFVVGTGRFATASLGKHYMAMMEALNVSGATITIYGGLPSIPPLLNAYYTGMTFEGRF